MLQVKILHRWCQGYMIHVLEFIPWGKHYLQIKGKYFFSIFLIISTISNINCLSRINSCKQSLSTNTVIVGGATLLYIDSTVVQLANECVNNLTSDNTMAFDIESRVRVVYQVEISGQLYHLNIIELNAEIHTQFYIQTKMELMQLVWYSTTCVPQINWF